MAAATRPARTAAKRCSLSIANWTSCAGCTHQHCCAVVSLPLTGRCPALVHRSRCSGFVVNNVNHCERAGAATVKSRPFVGTIYAFQRILKRRNGGHGVGQCGVIAHEAGWVSMPWLPPTKRVPGPNFLLRCSAAMPLSAIRCPRSCGTRGELTNWPARRRLRRGQMAGLGWMCELLDRHSCHRAAAR